MASLHAVRGDLKSAGQQVYHGHVAASWPARANAQAHVQFIADARARHRLAVGIQIRSLQLQALGQGLLGNLRVESRLRQNVVDVPARGAVDQHFANRVGDARPGKLAGLGEALRRARGLLRDADAGVDFRKHRARVGAQGENRIGRRERVEAILHHRIDEVADVPRIDVVQALREVAGQQIEVLGIAPEAGVEVAAYLVAATEAVLGDQPLAQRPLLQQPVTGRHIRGGQVAAPGIREFAL